jgi:hypothetical protein
MQRNIGNVERSIRIIVGLGILSLTVIGPQTPWALLGIFPVLTGIIGWCPPYHLLGINTCRKGDKCEGRSCWAKS